MINIETILNEFLENTKKNMDKLQWNYRRKSMTMNVRCDFGINKRRTGTAIINDRILLKVNITKFNGKFLGLCIY